ncbi:hypothetical protein ACFLZY_02705, partial [Patescibacteria group bacterium]
SRFNPELVIQVTGTTLEKYPIGIPISFPNYSLLRSPAGTVYLLVDETLRGIPSQEVFRSIGFNGDEIVDVSFDDLALYTEGQPLSIQTTHPYGALLQDKTTGGVFYVEDGQKHPIMSREIMDLAFANLGLISTDPEDLDKIANGSPAIFPDGTLVAVIGSPDVFVISDGQRRHIKDEKAFNNFGWDWNKIVWTNERSVLLHPLSDDIVSEPPQISEVQLANSTSEINN